MKNITNEFKEFLKLNVHGQISFLSFYRNLDDEFFFYVLENKSNIDFSKHLKMLARHTSKHLILEEIINITNDKDILLEVVKNEFSKKEANKKILNLNLDEDEHWQVLGMLR